MHPRACDYHFFRMFRFDRRYMAWYLVLERSWLHVGYVFGCIRFAELHYCCCYYRKKFGSKIWSYEKRRCNLRVPCKQYT